MLKSLSIIVLLFLGFKTCQVSSTQVLPKVDAPPKEQMLRGLNFVAPPNAFESNPMNDVKAINADWIAVIPYGFTRLGEAKVYFDTNRQWWGERSEGARETIRLAQEADINVVLKPQVYVPRSWTGDLDFNSDAEWSSWEVDYTNYILTFVQIAEEMNVKVFCIGTEFKIGAKKREAYWRSLIDQVRKVYKGKLIYAANWDSYTDVPFWDALDFVGINAYFPLDNSKTPSVETLKEAWIPHKKSIRNFYNRHKKPIVFTEYGYLSVDGTAYNTWELESKVQSLPINEQAQANAIQALLETFWEEPYWHGGFIWKWFPQMKGGEGYNTRDYTPQDKIAQGVLTEWYAKPIFLERGVKAE
jgi:hypothetical protein